MFCFSRVCECTTICYCFLLCITWCADGFPSIILIGWKTVRGLDHRPFLLLLLLLTQIFCSFSDKFHLVNCYSLNSRDNFRCPWSTSNVSGKRISFTIDLAVQCTHYIYIWNDCMLFGHCVTMQTVGVWLKHFSAKMTTPTTKSLLACPIENWLAYVEWMRRRGWR